MIKLSFSHKEKHSRLEQTLKPTKKASHNEALITFLTRLLKYDWETNSEKSAKAFSTKIDEPEGQIKEHSLRIWILRLLKANSIEPSKYVFASQFDMEELETYNKAMSGVYVQQWSQVVKEELDQLETNKTWSLIYKSQIKPGFKSLGGKWVYKIKQDVNEDIVSFKVR